MMIPTILIHNGLSEYVHITATQASKYNKVFLITDSEYPKNSNYQTINIHDIYQFDTSPIDLLHKNYIHLYRGPKDPVLFWITRWFILYNFCRQRDLSTVFHIDSDVLLFADPNKEWIEKYKNYFMTLTLGTCGSTAFFSLESLYLLTNFINKIYIDKQIYFDYLQNKYNSHLKYNLHGGVCDMALLKMFKDYYGINRIGEMTHIINNETYDHNINVNDYEYAMDTETNMKNIQVIDNKPCVYNNRLNRYIIFHGLHHQGAAKQYIQKIYEKYNEYLI